MRTILETEFVEDEEIVLYDLNKLYEIPDKIKHLLENEEMAENIANRGNKIAMEKHQWKNRAEEIIKLMKMIY